MDAADGFGHGDGDRERGAFFWWGNSGARTKHAGWGGTVAWGNSSGDSEEDAIGLCVVFELCDILKYNFDLSIRWDVTQVCCEDLGCLLFQQTCSEALAYSCLIGGFCIPCWFDDTSNGLGGANVTEEA